jgi:uncharacterized membrane protein YkoI
MTIRAPLLAGLLFGCLAADGAVAAERKARASCLTLQERNAVIAARKAVPLARAMRVVKSKVSGDVVNARLCRREAPKGLVYVLTVLSRNGKVTTARVDAADGQWLGGS